jgi:DNA polymerase-4
MDYFYAQVEIRDNPSLKGKPVIISGPPNSRSVVGTCSYEAREYGIRAGMPAFMVPKKCPDAVFVNANFEKYREVSRQIHEIFQEYSDIIEPMGLDEAYIDVTINKKGIIYAVDVAKQIQGEIYYKLDLTCSIGVSYNKMLSKIGSDYLKPCGITVIKPKNAVEFLKKLDLSKIPGVGKKMVANLNSKGLYYGNDYYSVSLEKAEQYFGKIGIHIYFAIRGVDNSKIIVNRKRKSIAHEVTLNHNIVSYKDIKETIYSLVAAFVKRLLKVHLGIKTVTLKIKFEDFSIITRSKTLRYPTQDQDAIIEALEDLIRKSYVGSKTIRLLGVAGSNLIEEEKMKNIMRFEQIYLDLGL